MPRGYSSPRHPSPCHRSRFGASRSISAPGSSPATLRKGAAFDRLCGVRNGVLRSAPLFQLLPWLCVLPVLILACGAGSDRVPYAGPRGPDAFDACALFPASEAKAELPEREIGQLSGPLDVSSGTAFARCAYGRGPGAILEAALEVRRYEDRSALRRNLEAAQPMLRRLSGGDLSAVSGVGDIAWWAGGELRMLKVGWRDLELTVTAAAGRRTRGSPRRRGAHRESGRLSPRGRPGPGRASPGGRCADFRRCRGGAGRRSLSIVPAPAAPVPAAAAGGVSSRHEGPTGGRGRQLLSGRSTQARSRGPWPSRRGRSAARPASESTRRAARRIHLLGSGGGQRFPPARPVAQRHRPRRPPRAVALRTVRRSRAAVGAGFRDATGRRAGDGGRGVAPGGAASGRGCRPSARARARARSGAAVSPGRARELRARTARDR